MKYGFKLAVGLVLLSAMAAWALQVGPTKFKGDRIQIGGAESFRCMTMPIDSLGANAANKAIFKTPRGMIVYGGSVVCNTSAFTAGGGGQKATVILKSGASIATISVDGTDLFQDTIISGGIHFDSAATCTLTVDDGTGDGTGGVNAYVMWWYNDDYNVK